MNKRFRAFHVIGFFSDFRRARVTFLSRVRRLRTPASVAFHSKGGRARINLDRLLFYFLVTIFSTRNRVSFFLYIRRERTTSFLRMRASEIVSFRSKERDRQIFFFILFKYNYFF